LRRLYSLTPYCVHFLTLSSIYSMFCSRSFVQRAFRQSVASMTLSRASRSSSSTVAAAATATTEAPAQTPTPSTTTTLATLKTQLLEASIQNVHQYGWTQEAIIMAAMERRKQAHSNASLSMVGLVNTSDLIYHVMNQFHCRLDQDLQQLRNDDFDAFLASTATQRLAHAIRLRLEYQCDYINAQNWHQAMALGASPDNALQTQQQLKSLIELMFQHAYSYNQDSPPSSSMSGSSELAKLTLGGVYVATELHMLTDNSLDYADSWAFLERRIAEWDQATSLLPTFGSDSLFVPSAVASAFASGLASLLLPSTAAVASNAFGDLKASMNQAPDLLWSSLVQKEKQVDETDPAFYRADNKSV
jgi:ubiquinone biosynthesis protein COQ9